ncbi:MAG TPA: YwiC-like family protein [Acidimicrobiales bacterium]|nr:YwiC-like family protein [Acidimicrobiales bacterium]
MTDTTAPASPAPTRPRSPLKAVALPAEHGGWVLAAEPVLLGLLVAPSVAGVALGVAAVVAFTARTPLKVVLVDRWRGRRLARTTLAARVAAAELVVLVACVAVAFATADGAFWAPLALAAPLVGVELWFDMRSRSRRLVPELAGSVGIASVAAAIVLAAGDAGGADRGARLAVGLWLVVAARAVATLPFVRLQLARAKGQAARVARSDAAQAAGLALGVVAVVLDRRLVAGLAALAVVAAVDLVGARRPPPPAVVLGLRQLALGLGVVAATAAGVILL